MVADCPAGYYCIQSSYRITDLALLVIGLGVFIVCVAGALYLIGRMR